MPRLSRIVASASLEILKSVAAILTPGDRSWLARRLMNDRLDPRTRALGDLFNKAVLAWKNKQYDVEANGEAALLRRLQPFKPKVLIDVGANIGEWSVAACAGLPHAHIHAFEIAPAIAFELAKNVQQFPGRVSINTVGLGSREGEIQLYWSQEESTVSSTIEGVVEISAADYDNKTINKMAAKIITGDQYLNDRRIESVDFLKIDVEGAEWEVLQGFSQAFARQKIQMVQFEYGPLSLKTKVLLGDFWKYFTDNGFIVGKLYPEGVAFKKFEWKDEDFVGPNYIAVRESRTDLVEGLRCEPL
jgi:FkbM family methyltransferase